MARVPHFPPARRTLLLAALAGAATLPVPAADAMAARYVAKPAGGGRIALDVVSGQLRRIQATLPSRCENDHGGSWSARLAIDESGAVALQSGRFGFQGQAPQQGQVPGRRAAAQRRDLGPHPAHLPRHRPCRRRRRHVLPVRHRHDVLPRRQAPLTSPWKYGTLALLGTIVSSSLLPVQMPILSLSG